MSQQKKIPPYTIRFHQCHSGESKEYPLREKKRAKDLFDFMALDMKNYRSISGLNHVTTLVLLEGDRVVSTYKLNCVHETEETHASAR